MNAGDSKVADMGAVAESRALLSKRMVAVRLGICSRTLERLVASGSFPRPLAIAGAIRWEPWVVEVFIERARKSSDGKASP